MSEPGEWKARAACRAVDPDLFFPDGKRSRVGPQIRRAVAICALCPVRIQCRDEWMALPVYYRRGCVAGGWYWTAKDLARPFPGDEHLITKAST